MLVVDHKHQTKKEKKAKVPVLVRGLLCRFCNRYKVGRFKDWEEVQRIVDYLRIAEEKYERVYKDSNV